MSEQQHTPTPWQLDNSGRRIIRGGGLSHPGLIAFFERQCDAQFAFIACNNFEKLAEALRECTTNMAAALFSQNSELLESIDALRLRLKTINSTVMSALRDAGME